MTRGCTVAFLLLLEAYAAEISPEARRWNGRLDAERSRWEPRLGERLTLEGEAHPGKLGAQVGDMWIAVPEGADLEKSRRRYLLENVEWRRQNP